MARRSGPEQGAGLVELDPRAGVAAAGGVTGADVGVAIVGLELHPPRASATRTLAMAGSARCFIWIPHFSVPRCTGGR